MDNHKDLCVIVPVYNHGSTAGSVVEAIRQHGLELVLVDDGSRSETRHVLEDLAGRIEGCHLVRLEKNSGKGGAVIAGLKWAMSSGYARALQVDADGQHDLDRIPYFLERSDQNPGSLIAGAPEYDESAPSSRLAGRKITNFWVALETLSNDISDAMCGFRVYPVEASLKALRALHVDKRMGFDIEVLVRIHWSGVPMEFHPVKVDYPEGGISNFRMVRDNIGISLVHTKLFFGMLLRLPLIVLRKMLRRRK